MRLTLILPLLFAIFFLPACDRHQEQRNTKVRGIECDAKCQARMSTSGSGNFPSLDLDDPAPRKNGKLPAGTATDGGKSKE